MGRLKEKKRKKREESEDKRGYPLRIQAGFIPYLERNDYTHLITSFVFCCLFYLEEFRELPIAAPLKTIPVGALSMLVMKKKSVMGDAVTPYLIQLSAGMMFHCLGDSYLHQTDDNMFVAAILFGIGWIFYSLFLWNAVTYFEGEPMVPKEQKKNFFMTLWQKMNLLKKCISTCLMFLLIFACREQLSNFNALVDDWIQLIVIPYGILEVVPAILALLVGEFFTFMGISFFIASDLMLNYGYQYSWPLYCIAQWLICYGGFNISERIKKKTISFESDSPFLQLFGQGKIPKPPEIS